MTEPWEQGTAAQNTTGRHGRAGLVLGVAVAALVVLAVVAAVLSATRPAPQLPAGSPEAAVQDYLRLVADGDLDAAAQLLDPDGRCTVEDLQRARVDRQPRIVLRGAEVDGDRADVRVDLVHGQDGPLGVDSWESEERFSLVRAGDHWVITGEPWPMYDCAQRVDGR